jgi:zinc transporter
MSTEGADTRNLDPDSDSTDGGFRWAYLLESGKALSWEEARAWKPEDGRLWVHLDRSEDDAQTWIREQAGLDPATSEALLAEETRPRCYVSDDSLLLILRGVNLNPGAEPDEMISIRLWVESKRLISLRQRRLKATYDVAGEIDAGKGPRDVAALLVRLAVRVSERMDPVLENLEDLTDALEEGLTAREPKETRAELAELRRQVIALRRYLSPQRVVLSSLALEQISWLQPAHRSHLRELADRTTRHVEDLEALRERAGVIHDELLNHVSEQLNTRMYVLSLVAAIFLPLSLLTGLLGINVGGIPGANDPGAFLVVCLLLVGLGFFLAVILRWRRWL